MAAALYRLAHLARNDDCCLQCLKFNQRPNRGAPTPAAAAAAVRKDSVYMAKIVQRLPIQSFETPADLQLLSATALLVRCCSSRCVLVVLCMRTTE